ncbi:hypothetical protein K7432_005011 [Basidiobolus ranarum]|uniref:SH3 domain-containing protein n=1 Tax=Basidiobolus ranarum TaxID=34480 RepID=A0ABR2WXE5_9FUNG
MSHSWKNCYFSPRSSSLLVILAFYTLPSLAQSSQTVLDFSSLSQLSIAGQFNGISTYSPNSNVSRLNPNVDSLIRKTKNTLELVGYTSVGGSINAMCNMPSKQGGGDVDLQAQIFVAGNFTHIGGVEVNNIALYDPSTRLFSPLVKGLDGPIYDLYCDASRNIVYVGGAFTGPVPVNISDKYGLLQTFGGSIAMWSNGNWTGFGFKGLNGPVYTIGASNTSSSIFFGGNFNSTADGAQNMAPNIQEVNLINATISGGNSASTTGFSNPKNVICSGDSDTVNNIWLMRDNMPGYWWAQFSTPITPSLLRIKNTNYEGRGTKTFRLFSFPGNLIIPLSYYDPNTRKTVTCSDECPLNHDPSLPFQDFRIIQGDKPTTLSGINIDILSWYGAGGGFGKIQLYQSEIVVHAINEYNNPACASSSQPIKSSVSLTGSWERQTEPDSSKSILSYTVKNSKDNKASITYTPFIPESGYYEIWASIPGCYDDDCEDRISVDFSLTLTKSAKQSVTNTIPQNNNFDNVVPIYMGYVTASSANFQPKVVATISKKSKIKTGNVFVADAIQFVKLNSLYNLNGVVEYFPDSASIIEGIPIRALQKPLPVNSVVKSIIPTNTSVFIGGDFRGVDKLEFANIVKYNRNALVPFTGGYPRGPVNSMTLINNELIIGGDFDGLIGNSKLPARNIASYNIINDKWSPVGYGVNDQVKKLVPAGSEAVQIIGDFNVVYGNNTPFNPDRFSTGFTSWNLTSKSWANPVYVAGHAHSSIVFTSQNSSAETSRTNTFYLAGAFSSAAAIQAPGFITLDSRGDFEQLGTGPESGAVSTTVNCGTYYLTNDKENGQNMSYSIVGGNFQSTGIRNVAIFDQGVWKGIGTGVSGEVYSLHVAESQLFIGGLSNNTSTPPFKGFSIWDFKNNSFTDVPSLGSSSSRDAKDDGLTKVNVIRQRHGTSNVIVSGWFKRAGSLECNNICLWDTKDKQWVSLSSGVEGEVTDMIVTNSDIIAVGNFVLSSGQGYLANYDFDKSAWKRIEPKGDEDTLPGAALSIIHDSGNNIYYVAGQNDKEECYMRKWDGTRFTPLPVSPLPSSKISRMSIVPTKSVSNANNQVVVKIAGESEPSAGSALMVVGSLVFEKFGNVSAALFNGEEWIPVLVSSQRDGSPGIIKSAFTRSIITFTTKDHLPLPLVILVSVASSLGLVFFIMLIGLGLIYLKKKRRAAKYPHPNALYAKKPYMRESAAITSVASADSRAISDYSDQYRSQAPGTSTSAMEKSMNESSIARTGALATAGLGAGISAAQGGRPHSGVSEKHASASPTLDASIMSSPERYTMLSEGKIADGMDTGAVITPDRYQVYYAKFPFNAREHGELGFQAGDKIYVIDNTDDIWWMGIIDHGDGGQLSQGVFPASYVVDRPSSTSTTWNTMA